VIQIIVPTKSGGVYDFACKLKNAIGNDISRLVVLTEENIKDWTINSEDSVLLQMSGYGFAKRGAPLWLLREFKLRRREIKSLGIFFHEIYAFSPPWRSSFWLSPVQRYISRRFVELSDYWMTNREGSAYWLRQFAADKPHDVLPVFSNIGEPETIASMRLPKIVIFGGAGLRQVTYKMAGDDLFVWAREQALEIHDIGTPILDEKIAESLRINNVIQHGQLQSDVVSRLLADSQFGVVAYPIEYVAKSSVFNAYCSHGVCPIIISIKYTQADGLTEKVHYIPSMPKSFVSTDKRQAVAQSARCWYQSHNLANHARSIRNLIENYH